MAPAAIIDTTPVWNPLVKALAQLAPDEVPLEQANEALDAL